MWILWILGSGLGWVWRNRAAHPAFNSDGAITLSQSLSQDFAGIVRITKLLPKLIGYALLGALGLAAAACLVWWVSGFSQMTWVLIALACIIWKLYNPEPPPR